MIKLFYKNGGTIKSAPDSYKNEEMFNKAVDDYPHALEFVPECYKTQEMCDKGVNTHSSTIEFVLESCKTQKMCDKAFNNCFLTFFVFPIDIKLKNCVTELFLKILFK